MSHPVEDPRHLYHFLRRGLILLGLGRHPRLPPRSLADASNSSVAHRAVRRFRRLTRADLYVWDLESTRVLVGRYEGLLNAEVSVGM